MASKANMKPSPRVTHCYNLPSWALKRYWGQFHPLWSNSSSSSKVQFPDFSGGRSNQKEKSIVDQFLGLKKRTVFALCPSKRTGGNYCVISQCSTSHTLVSLFYSTASLFVFSLFRYVHQRALCHPICQRQGPLHRSCRTRQKNANNFFIVVSRAYQTPNRKL